MTSLWKVEYWADSMGRSDIEEWLDSLTKEEFKSLAKEIRLLEFCGNQLKLPHSRSLKLGLFELRERNYGLRIYYGFLPNKLIILFNAGNKDTQTKDIEVARQRLYQLKHSYSEVVI